MTEKTVLVFAYGSNLCLERIGARISEVRVVVTGRVDGFRLAFHKRSRDGSGKADAFFTGDPSDCVWGAVYALLADDKEKLDRFEGLGVDYLERAVSVRTLNKSRASIDAVAYIASKEKIDKTSKPYDWYHDFVRRGARQHGLPEEYVREIELWSTQHDPDATRSTRERSVLIPYD